MKKTRLIKKVGKHLYELPYAHMSQTKRMILLILGIAFISIFLITIISPFDLGYARVKGERMEQNTIIRIFTFIASAIIIPVFFKSGTRFDLKRGVFQEYQGFLGKTKSNWTKISEIEYLSIVKVNIQNSAESFVSFSAYSSIESKLYFVFANSHQEIYCDYYDDVRALAEWFKLKFKLEINDLVKSEKLEKNV